MELSEFFIDSYGELVYTDNIFNGYYLDIDNNIKCKINNVDIDWTFEEVCFLYEQRTFNNYALFLKHGAYNFVLSCRNYDIQCLKKYNSADQFNFKIIIIPSEQIKKNFDLLEDVNKVINCTGYIDLFLKKYLNFKII